MKAVSKCHRLLSRPTLGHMTRRFVANGQMQADVTELTQSQYSNLLTRLQELHPKWIRERCTKNEKTCKETKQPLLTFSQTIPIDLEIDEFILRDNFTDEKQEVEVIFSDGHRSEFLLKDLIHNLDEYFGGVGGVQSENYVVPAPTPWSSRYKFDYELLRTDENRLFHFCQEVLLYGLTTVSNIPPAPEGSIRPAIAQVADIIGPVRKTGWGEVFNVRASPDDNKKDLAYTGKAIPPHTDNPYRDHAPGYQWLHCITNKCRGGYNYFVDGFHCAEEVRKENPDFFDILTKVHVRFENFDGHKNRSYSYAPILALDNNGQLKQIRYSDKSGGYAPPLPKSQLNLFYAAKHALCEQINNHYNHSWLRLNDGEAVVVDNHRILHARTSFDPSEGLRHFQGCYTERDGITSKYLELKNKLL